MTTPDFRSAADILYDRGWLTIPLVPDANGYPKKPITNNWTELSRTRETLDGLPWERAQGLGIVLGTRSSNLAVVDIDDASLADVVLELMPTRGVRTIRKRAHLYVIETFPSSSTVVQTTWNGRPIKVELKSNGTQVAAPPTPGYELAGKQPILTVPNVRHFFRELVASIDGLVASDITPESYPRPWREEVEADTRNKTAYVEAHRLREAGVALHLAKDIMQARIERHYESGDLKWEEIERTIESAYRPRIEKKRGVLRIERQTRSQGSGWDLPLRVERQTPWNQGRPTL
jgi:hypothetical protein